MQIGLGILGWSPDIFWKSTYRELMRACEGLAIKNGGGDAARSNPKPMSREEAKQLVEKYG